jgi:hypothetical protein
MRGRSPLRRSMDEGAADQKAERLEHLPAAGAGSIQRGGEPARQTSTAQASVASEGTRALLEDVLRRENLTRAYARVVQNGGAPGVDGITVGGFKRYLREHWPRVREALLSETYKPRPVRPVEIPKPNGGVRVLGIPTVLDRFIQQALLQVLQPLIRPDLLGRELRLSPGAERSRRRAARAAACGGGQPMGGGPGPREML